MPRLVVTAPLIEDLQAAPRKGYQHRTFSFKPAPSTTAFLRCVDIQAQQRGLGENIVCWHGFRKANLHVCNVTRLRAQQVTEQLDPCTYKISHQVLSVPAWNFADSSRTEDSQQFLRSSLHESIVSDHLTAASVQKDTKINECLLFPLNN